MGGVPAGSDSTLIHRQLPPLHASPNSTAMPTSITNMTTREELLDEFSKDVSNRRTSHDTSSRQSLPTHHQSTKSNKSKRVSTTSSGKHNNSLHNKGGELSSKRIPNRSILPQDAHIAASISMSRILYLISSYMVPQDTVHNNFISNYSQGITISDPLDRSSKEQSTVAAAVGVSSAIPSIALSSTVGKAILSTSSATPNMNSVSKQLSSSNVLPDNTSNNVPVDVPAKHVVGGHIGPLLQSQSLASLPTSNGSTSSHPLLQRNKRQPSQRGFGDRGGVGAGAPEMIAMYAINTADKYTTTVDFEEYLTAEGMVGDSHSSLASMRGLTRSVSKTNLASQVINPPTPSTSLKGTLAKNNSYRMSSLPEQISSNNNNSNIITSSGNNNETAIRYAPTASVTVPIVYQKKNKLLTTGINNTSANTNTSSVYGNMKDVSSSTVVESSSLQHISVRPSTVSSMGGTLVKSNSIRVSRS